MTRTLRKAGDRLLSVVLPTAEAKACGPQMIGRCYIGSGAYAARCDQWVNNCGGGASFHKIYDAWGNLIDQQAGACSCM